jgi:hypothetical protein
MTNHEDAVPASAVDRAGLRDRIADALATADGWKWAPGFKALSPTWQGYQNRTDAVLSVLPVPLSEVWVVWREGETAHGYFATEDVAKRATIDCWEEDEPVCPDYSWRRDGPRWELVVGGEHGGVYASRHRVYGEPAVSSVGQAERTARGAEGTLDRLRRIARRLAAHAVGFKDVLDDSDHGPWARTVGADIAELIEALADQPATGSAGGAQQSEPDPAVEPHCDGFPTTCPNRITVPPNPPHHDGGIRCGCYDEPAETRDTGPRCGNNPNVRLTPGDRKAVDEFGDFLARRQDGGPQTVLRCNRPDGEHQPHDWEPIPGKTARCFGDYERPRP